MPIYSMMRDSSLEALWPLPVGQDGAGERAAVERASSSDALGSNPTPSLQIPLL